MESKLGQLLEVNEFHCFFLRKTGVQWGFRSSCSESKTKKVHSNQYLEFELIIDVSSGPWFILVNPNVT